MSKKYEKIQVLSYFKYFRLEILFLVLVAKPSSTASPLDAMAFACVYIYKQRDSVTPEKILRGEEVG